MGCLWFDSPAVKSDSVLPKACNVGVYSYGVALPVRNDTEDGSLDESASF